jgi:phytoene dehydrogenase-like protein
LSTAKKYDAVVIGSGPNGLAAAVELARNGASVLVLEAAEEIGGGTRSKELIAPGYLHDVCSAIHPLGILSPYFRKLPLADFGLKWMRAPISVAHPLDGEPAVLLKRSLAETAESIGADGRTYQRLLRPLVERAEDLLEGTLGPFRIPRHPFLLARFGLSGLRSAMGLARGKFREKRARALLGGCAAHGIQPLDHPLTAAVGLMFLISGHAEDWPAAAGGSQAIAAALAGYLRSLGGEIRISTPVRSLKQLPDSRVVLFDTGVDQLVRLCEEELPAGYTRRLRKFRHGPGVFKIDWILDGPIPWSDPECARASTVHLGGTIEELALSEATMWRGEHAERPYVLLCQQSMFDPRRAPPGKHTGYAYIHVPAGSSVDCTGVVERQVERFAPGFRELIRGRHFMRATDFAQYNANYLGGAITGGVADLWQLFTRPVARLDPYSTPNPKYYLCSASTPPGGGVHGMCGYFAARSALRRLALRE